MTPQQVSKLSIDFPPLQPAKTADHMERLTRMRDFYESKCKTAPPGQTRLFRGFMASLEYSVGIIEMHHKLTHKIARAATDETGTNSEG